MTTAKSFRRYLRSLFALYGLYPAATLSAVRRTPAFVRDCIAFARMNRSPGEWPYGRFYPYLGDRRAAAGTATGHYFHQDLLVARRIYERKPVRHVDVGSRVDGFVAHVASFRTIEVADIRPLKATIPNITFTQVDLMAPLAAQHVAMCDSLSCLHALEHFGLGRYGDRLDPDGHLTGLANLARMVGEDGILYLSVPIGPQRIDFNSERVFGMAHLLGLIDRAGFDLLRFSYVDDHGDLVENQALSPVLVQTNCGVERGCGIFELTKRRPPASAAP